MDDTRPRATDQPSAVPPPFFQRIYDRPFLLLVVSIVIMFGIFTFWGLWEITHLPPATLP